MQTTIQIPYRTGFKYRKFYFAIAYVLYTHQLSYVKSRASVDKTYPCIREAYMCTIY